jgi:hypothetical protein
MLGIEDDLPFLKCRLTSRLIFDSSDAVRLTSSRLISLSIILVLLSYCHSHILVLALLTEYLIPF